MALMIAITIAATIIPVMRGRIRKDSLGTPQSVVCLTLAEEVCCVVDAKQALLSDGVAAP
jgi:hypothetical protein